MTKAAESDAAAPSVPARVARVLDQLITWFAVGAVDVAAAREVYESRRGKVHQEDPMWERWSAAFVEWFIVERLAPGEARPVAAAALGRDDADHEVIRALCTSHRSLFEVTRIDRGRAELIDLLGGGHFEVAEPRALLGVSPGDVAELRLVGVDNAVVFGRTFVFHPGLARGAIVDHARALLAGGKSRRDVIDVMAKLRLKLDRVVDPRLAISAHRQNAVRRVYELGQPPRR